VRRRSLLLLLLAATVARPASPQGADAVVAEVERRLRRPLGPAERRIVADAALDWTRGLRTLARRFAGDVASVAGLQAGQVAALVPDIADPLAFRTLGPEIETLRDRALSPRQRQRLAELDARRRSEVEALDRRLTEALGSVGLDAAGAVRTVSSLRGR
jgi:hypothetical protein